MPILEVSATSALAVAIVSGVLAGRREIVKLVLGIILVLRAQRQDLPAVARALFPRGGRQ